MSAAAAHRVQARRVFGEPPALLATLDHVVEVPLDHADPGRGTIEVYAREVCRLDLVNRSLPYLLFLQGGPGGRGPRPGADMPSWLGWALQRWRVVLLDQRGTGRSTPMDRWTLPRAAGDDPAAQADHLALFRADSIVADAEVLRRHLLGDVPWTVLGQSFGGFCTWTYLSFAPEGVAAALVTGGVPPATATADEVYERTFAAVARRTRDLDLAHPDVRGVLAGVARHVQRAPEHLPTGERLTVARLQEVGHVLGGTGGTDRLAHLADDAWAVPGERLSDTFLAGVAGMLSYAERPLYALVHEAIYADPGTSTRWSAQRVRDRLAVPEEPVEDPELGEVLPLTGEMVFPHTVGSDPALRPLAACAEALAARVWDRPLYDRDRLWRNEVPVVARVYGRDMFVDERLSEATAARTGAVTVQPDAVHHHDGLRRGGTALLDELLAGLPDRLVPPAHPAPDPAAAEVPG